MATVAAFFLGPDAARGYLLHQTGALVGDEGGALLTALLKGSTTSGAKG